MPFRGGAKGSSPRVRGAGKRVVSVCHKVRDHPRVCGEQCCSLSGSANGSGSSPRVRGAAMIKIEETETYGDHPRVCGEQTIRKSAIKSQTGSSPRVRGAEGADVAEVLARGIIPACAGSSTFESNRVATLRDHPRVCGEQAVRMHAYRCLKGSSPRVRGAVCGCVHTAPVDGIIPACAGSSLHSGRRGPRARDHPRVCGEQNSALMIAASCWGSSPRVRGAVGSWINSMSDFGIIPACAGSSRLKVTSRTA